MEQLPPTDTSATMGSGDSSKTSPVAPTSSNTGGGTNNDPRSGSKTESTALDKVIAESLDTMRELEARMRRTAARYNVELAAQHDERSPFEWVRRLKWALEDIGFAFHDYCTENYSRFHGQEDSEKKALWEEQREQDVREIEELDAMVDGFEAMKGEMFPIHRE